MNLMLILLMGSNFSFHAFATGGLETHMQTCLLMASTYCFLSAVLQRDFHVIRMIKLSVLLAAAFITRMDSAILVACILSATAFSIMKTGGIACRKSLLALVLPSALLALGCPWVSTTCLKLSISINTREKIRPLDALFLISSSIVFTQYIFLYLAHRIPR